MGLEKAFPDMQLSRVFIALFICAWDDFGKHFESFERGRGRAAGAAEDHMTCLDLLRMLRSLIGMVRKTIGTSLNFDARFPFPC